MPIESTRHTKTAAKKRAAKKRAAKKKAAAHSPRRQTGSTKQAKTDARERVYSPRGGRPLGEAVWSAREKLKSRDFDPMLKLVDIFHEADTTKEQRILIAKELAKYVYPAMKAVEHTSNMGAMSVTVVSGIPGPPGSKR